MITSKYRIVVGFAMLLAGVAVAIVGYIGVSGESEVAFQLPYFASAGVGALMLLGFGGIILLNAQLESDGDRLDELEEAVRQMSHEVGRLVDEMVPRRGARPARAMRLEEEKAEEGTNGGTRGRKQKALT